MHATPIRPEEPTLSVELTAAELEWIVVALERLVKSSGREYSLYLTSAFDKALDYSRESNSFII